MILNGLNDNGPVGDNDGMNDPQPIDPRRRIRELLAIPDRDRTDAEWDELNELEIRTAPGNREVPERSQDKRFNAPSPGHQKRQDRKQERKSPNAANGRSDGRQQEQRQEVKPQENRNQEGRPPRRQHRRPKRNPGNGTGGGTPGNGGAANGGPSGGGGGEGGSPA